MKDTTLFIAGAGPVGLTLAMEASRFGIPFRIIDKATERSTHSKALAIWSGTQEALAAMGVVQTFLDEGIKIEAIRLCDRGKQIAESSVCEHVESLYPQPLILPQSETERILIENLEKQGHAVERSTELISLTQKSDGVECLIRNADGSEETVFAKYVAGCEGARSVARKTVGCEFPGITESLNFILADAVIDGDVPNDKITISWNDNGAVAIFPVVQGIWRVFAQRHNEDTSDPTLEEIQKSVDELCPIGLKLHDPTWLSFFRINERVASKFYDDRIFLVGDAAHIHSPAGGQGMNTGMQDATNLAWKLALMTKGKGSAATLSESYQAERHPIAEAVVKGATDKLHIGMTKGPLMRVVKDLAVSVLLHVPAFRKILSHQLAELDFCYDHSPLTDRSAPWPHGREGFASGTRPRDVTLKDSAGKSVSLWNRFLQPRHTLLIFSGEKPDAACVQTEELIMLCAEASDEITPVVVWHGDEVPSGKHSGEYLLDPSAEAHRRYGAKGLSWYLIRPDQYTTIRCQPSETAPLERYIAKYFKA